MCGKIACEIRRYRGLPANADDPLAISILEDVIADFGIDTGCGRPEPQKLSDRSGSRRHPMLEAEVINHSQLFRVARYVLQLWNCGSEAKPKHPSP